MVLEAWKWAEKVWFPVVWEEIKDASNVIDYSINKEITIDTSATHNANNETTTWQATLTYWVNEPLIIDNTSIHRIIRWNNYVQIRASMYEITTDNDWHTYLWKWNIQDEWWTLIYGIWDYYNWNHRVKGWALIIPETWAYQAECSYSWWHNVWYSKYELLLNENQLKLYDSWLWNFTDTFTFSANRWDEFATYISWKFVWTISGTMYVEWAITIVLTKIW